MMAKEGRMKAVIAPRHLQVHLHNNEDPKGERLACFIELLEQLNLEVSLPDITELKSDLNECNILILTSRRIRYKYERWEIDLFLQYVNSGGSLLHLSNHKDFPLNDTQLGKHFGYKFENKHYKRSHGIIPFSIQIEPNSIEKFELDLDKSYHFFVNNCCNINIVDVDAEVIAKLPENVVEKYTKEPGKGLVFAVSIESNKKRGRIVAISESGIIGKPREGNPGPGLWAGDNGAIIKGIIKWLTYQT
jgi:hypothetical protein